MNLSYKILSVFGIDIELHLLFILFILAFLLISPQVALLLILIFFFVTLHELTHSIVAIKNKIRVKKIILLPIGGMAMVESADMSPITEIKMSLAGPLLNIILAYVCIAIAYIFSIPLGTWLTEFLDPTQAFNLTFVELIFFYSFYANLILGIFNLFLPAFPLDGGRILRALLALKLEYVRASRIAKNISLGIAGLLFFIAFLYGEIWIMIISFFIAFGAVAEFNSMLVHKTLAGVKIRDVLSKDFLLLSQKETVRSALVRMMAKRKMGALIKTRKGLKIISLADVARLPRENWGKKAVSIAKPTGHMPITSSLENVIRKMDHDEVSIIPIFDGRKLVGAVDRFEIERVMRILETVKTNSK